MRILYLVHRFPFPPDKGDKIRSFHWLEALRRHHEVHLVTLMPDPADAVHLAELESRCASAAVIPMKKIFPKLRALGAVVRGGALSVAHFQERKARAAMKRVLAEHDIDLILEFSAAMADFPVGDKKIPRVLDMVDVDSQKFSGYADLASGGKKRLFAMEAKRLRAFEQECVRDHEVTLLCTEQEAELLRSFAGAGRIDFVQNGAALPPDPSACGAKPHLVFVGAMDYQANIDAVVWGAREIMPLVLATCPDARFLIVGRHPTQEVKALASLQGVEVHENAPDVGVYLDGAAAGFIPLRVAQGIQNKVLEAMAHRLPVITHPRVASALHARPGDDILIAETAQDYAEHIKVLFDSQSRAQEIGDAGRRLVERDFAWKASYDALESILQSVVKGAQS